MMEAISPTFFMEEISPILNFMRNSRSTAEISVMVDPFACKRIIEALPETMKKYNIEKLKDIIGGAH